MKKECLKVAVFLDGRPGHEKQTLGIIQALSDLTPVETKEVRVQRERGWKRVLHTLRYFLSIDIPIQDDFDDFDLMIGTGTATHLPMLSCKRKNNLPVVTCMTPASHLLRRFDLCFIPQHDSPAPAENVFTTIGPPNCSSSLGSHSLNHALILVGGIDHKSHHWSESLLEQQVRSLIEEAPQLTWTISSSPRTPRQSVEILEKISQELSNVTFCNYRSTPPGWVEKEYNQNQWVWVTADSLSMVYEALSAGCKVGILPVRWKNPRSKFVVSESFLIEKGLVVSFGDKEGWSGVNKSMKPFNEAKRCAKELLCRWKRKSLQ